MKYTDSLSPGPHKPTVDYPLTDWRSQMIPGASLAKHAGD